MKASLALPKPAERDGNVGRAPAWMERGFVRAFPDDHVNLATLHDRGHIGRRRHDELASSAVASELSTTRLLA